MITQFKIFENIAEDYKIFMDILRNHSLHGIEKYNLVEKYIEDGRDIEALDNDTTILMSAVSYGESVIVKKLIDAGADVNNGTEWSNPLMRFGESFYKYNDLEMLKILLDADAKIITNGIGNNFITELHDDFYEKEVLYYMKTKFPEKYKEYMKMIQVKKFKI